MIPPLMKPQAIPLPIDALMPEIVGAFLREKQVLVRASPGSGKTTRIPVALESALAGAIFVLQPRRIAARLAAERVASELGSAPGERVGYHFRFEKKRGPATRIVFFTEGLFLRELQSNPELRGVAAVLLDEFHERHLSTDLALGACLDLQAGVRPDIKIGILSATLDADGVGEFLARRSGGAVPATLHQNLERHPLTIEYGDGLQRAGDRNRMPGAAVVSEGIARGLRRWLARGTGGASLLQPGAECLVFLPGMREIRETERRLKEELPSLKIVCLHSELTKEEQAAALVPDPGIKVILATNIAESSVTFPRVRAVIDSGLVRQKEFRSGSGLERLVTRLISQASAIQRAGRAGRVGPGQVLRLYDEHEFMEMRKLETPEILRTDPVEVAFEIYRLGRSPSTFPLLGSPPKSALENARAMLEEFGVVRDERLTDVGRALRELPLSPRLGLLFREADRTGLRRELLPLIVKLQEGEDLPLDARDAFGDAEFKGFAARRAFDQLDRLPRTGKGEPPVRVPVEIPLVRIFPERLGRVDRGKIYLATGRTFRLGSKLSDEVKDGDYLLVLDAEEKDAADAAAGTEMKVFSWLPIERSAIEEHCVDDLVFTKRATLDSAAGRILRVEEERFRELVIERWERAVDWDDLGEDERTGLVPEIEAHYFREGSALRLERAAWLERLLMHQAHSPALREVAPDAFAGTFARLLLERFAELRRLTPEKILDAIRPTYARDATLDRLARDFPDAIALPRRKRVPLNYESGKNPWMESRLQDFLGLKAGPKLLDGKLPITLHLNAPNGRAVQVTEDLERFWKVHYPTIRKELMRRYPRHKWPEDPTALYIEENP